MKGKVIDLRSDTVTLPSDAMRKAMSEAIVGDDVFGEDPTVNKLEEMAAQRLGKEAGLFVTSGTQGNLVSVLTHCTRGDQIILGDKSHIQIHELGGYAALGGIHGRTVRNLPDGRLPIDEIGVLISDGSDVHEAPTKLICLENTWNGRILKQDYVSEVRELANAHGLSMHLDGARVFNAAVAQNLPVSQVVRPFDTVQFCFSKGLSAPVGSMLCGTREFIKRARRSRKMVGGGMRQAGVLAAACIVALEQMVERLQDDHENATRLADALLEMKGIELNRLSVETNMVVFTVNEHAAITAPQLVQRLEEEGVKLLMLDHEKIRAVMHFGIERQDVVQVIAAFNRVMQSVVQVS
jgi:threonine aldolase